MSGKSSKGKTSTRNEKDNSPAGQSIWMRVAFAIFAVILILSMLLSAVATY